MTPQLHRSMDSITREILHFEDLAMRHTEDAVKFKMEVGRRLLAAKQQLPHGQFMPWAKKTFGWDHRHVTRHMQLARNWSKLSTLPDDASLRMAISALTTPKPSGPATAGNTRFALMLGTGEEAILELRSGDPEQVAFTLKSGFFTFRRLEPSKRNTRKRKDPPPPIEIKQAPRCPLFTN